MLPVLPTGRCQGRPARVITMLFCASMTYRVTWYGPVSSARRLLTVPMGSRRTPAASTLWARHLGSCQDKPARAETSLCANTILEGRVLWTRQFGTSGSDLGAQLKVYAGGVYVVGNTDGALPGQTNAGGQDFFVVKYNPQGGVLWKRQFGSARCGLCDKS